MQLPRSVPLSGCLLTGFIMVCSLGLLGVLAVPLVGEALGPLVCASGETMTSTTRTYSMPGRTTQEVFYACTAANGEQRAVDFGELIWAGLKVYVGFFALVVFPLVTLFMSRARRRAAAMMPAGGLEGLFANMKVERRQSGWPILPQPPSPPQERESAAERLRALDSLHAEGLITDSEYAAKKAEILREL